MAACRSHGVLTAFDVSGEGFHPVRPSDTNDSIDMDGANTEVIDGLKREADATHAILDLASVPRTGLDKQVLSLEQRATIIVSWYTQGSRR